MLKQLAPGVNIKLLDLEEDELENQVKKYMAIGVLIGQTKLIDASTKLLKHEMFTSGENQMYRPSGMNQNLPAELKLPTGYDWDTFSDFDTPVFKVLNQQSSKLLTNLTTIYNSLRKNNYDDILFVDRIDLELNPNLVINTDKRIIAARSTSKNLKLGLAVLKRTQVFTDDPISLDDIGISTSEIEYIRQRLRHISDTEFFSAGRSNLPSRKRSFY